MALTVKTKDWAAGRRWARRNAIATPGVTYTIVRDGRHLSYRYEDGLMYCTGTQADEALPSQKVDGIRTHVLDLSPVTLSGKCPRRKPEAGGGHFCRSGTSSASKNPAT
jgi:hypothetical protein